MMCRLFFFFNDTATTEIYTLSLHDALPICPGKCRAGPAPCAPDAGGLARHGRRRARTPAHRLHRLGRSEEHTSELQSRLHPACRLRLEKKKNRGLYLRAVPNASLTCGNSES